jgi:hypothetical protein
VDGDVAGRLLEQRREPPLALLQQPLEPLQLTDMRVHLHHGFDLAVLVGPPNAGSVLSLGRLVHGMRFGPMMPRYPAAVIGTMPSVYQLLPRSRHGRVVDADTGEPVDLFDPETWRRFEWGLLDPESEETVAWLTPGVDDPEERRRIAEDHLQKSLDRARQLHEALDRPAARPDEVELHLVVGDAEATPDRAEVDPATGQLRYADDAPGDGTVTRTSALMDERLGTEWQPRLQSPEEWSSVVFVFADHLGMTKDPRFTDMLLYLLLEKPRQSPTGAEE